MSVVASMLAQVSLARIADVFNAGVEAHPVDGFSSVKKFTSKDAGIARVEKFIAAHDGSVDLVVDSADGEVLFRWQAGEPALTAEDYEAVDLQDPHAASNALIAAAVASGDLDLPEVTEVDEPAEAPFVKLSKAELDALGERGSPAREAYRKARRAAARQARKAKGE